VAIFICHLLSHLETEITIPKTFSFTNHQTRLTEPGPETP
jgi:hypothetical protein